MVYEAKIAHRMGLCDKEVFDRIKALIKRAGLSFALPEISDDRIIETMYIDKKAREGKIMMILPEKIGKVSIKPVDNNLIMSALEEKEVFE